MTIWFTSDTHFNHANVIKYCQRPFKSVEEMNAGLVAKWNASVKPGDDLYFLGDFALGKERDAVDHILPMLNGRKFLIKGNHDASCVKATVRWASVHDYLEIRPEGAPLIVLCHYPFAVWNGSHHGSINLHGHSHGTFKSPNPRQIDVGVDCWDYKPVSLRSLMDFIVDQEKVQGQTYKPADHHGTH